MAQEDLKIGIEKFDEVLPELLPLLEEQYIENEPGYVEQGIELDPDFDIYRLLEQKQNLFVVVLRIDGKIIGYFVMLKQPHLHHRSKALCSVDILYVAPEHRGGSAIFTLMEFMVGMCDMLQAKWLRIGMKVDQKFEKLLKNNNFELDEVVYSLDLGK